MRSTTLALVSVALAHAHRGPSTAGFENATTHPSQGGGSICVSGYIPVEAKTDQGIKFNYELPANESVLVEDWLRLNIEGSTFAEQIRGPNKTLGGNYSIHGTLCVAPDSVDSLPSSIQLLTHGLWADQTYWDFAPGYSFIDVATASGFATFSYDRLSVGKSTITPTLLSQSPLELEVLHALASKLRTGALSNKSFSTIHGVGHSYGSILTQALTAKYPSDINGAAILTAFSPNKILGSIPLRQASLNVDLASDNQPHRFAPDLYHYYVIPSTIISLQMSFFTAPGFDPAILSLTEDTKSPISLGCMFTVPDIQEPATHFTGPVAVVNGEDDLIFCLGNCTYPAGLSYPAQVLPALYPNLSPENFTTKLLPTTGHFVNMHYSANGAFHWIQKFIKEKTS